MVSYNLATVLVVVVVAMAGIYRGAADSEHYEVAITNMLGEEEMSIVECTYKSPLGAYSMAYNTDVKWDLLIGDDQPFKCLVYWQNKYVNAPLFIRSKQGKKCSIDNKCNWRLKPDGIYFMGDGSSGNGERVLQWNE